MKRRMLDLFCGRGGWTNAFLDRGWEVLGVDLVRQAEYRGELWVKNVMELTPEFVEKYDFVCASSPCEQFSVFGMPHFHANPPYPAMGIKLFNHTREICELSGKPYLMENVKHAQLFVGPSVHHCGSFHLWGKAVPPLMPQGISKTKWTMHDDGRPGNWCPELYINKRERAAKLATIPPELAHCVAEYAERILEQGDYEARPSTESSSHPGV